ncbi:MAG: carbon storage regulator [Thermoguttaceae bacterium]|nr:carbon storage regulator [Thermoguttaceae bacterium]
MLVLSRRAQESICIGPDIVVTVAEIRPRSVRLAISAPPTTSVHRLEVHSRIDEAVRAAEAQIGNVGSPGPDPGHSLPALDPPREV